MEILNTITECDFVEWRIVSESDPQNATLLRVVEGAVRYSFSGFLRTEAEEFIEVFMKLVSMGAVEGAFAMLEAEAQVYSAL